MTIENEVMLILGFFAGVAASLLAALTGLAWSMSSKPRKEGDET